MDRAKSGKGQKVETALLRTAINITNSHLIEQAMLDLNRIATLNRGFTAGPSDTFKCKDGWIYAMTIGQPLFVRWCRLMGDEDLAKDPRFKDDLARGDNGEALSAIMQKWCDAPHRRRGAGGAGGQPHPGRRRLYAAADARRPACAGGRLLPSDGVSRRGQAGAGAAGAGEALAHAAHDPPPRAQARRAYRPDPAGTGLRASRHRKAAGRPRRLIAADGRACPPAAYVDGVRFRNDARLLAVTVALLVAGPVGFCGTTLTLSAGSYLRRLSRRPADRPLHRYVRAQGAAADRDGATARSRSKALGVTAYRYSHRGREEVWNGDSCSRCRPRPTTTARSTRCGRAARQRPGGRAHGAGRSRRPPPRIRAFRDRIVAKCCRPTSCRHRSGTSRQVNQTVAAQHPERHVRRMSR